MLKVLFTGNHENHYNDNGLYYDIYPLYCAVTLIQENDRNILIDTGFYSATDMLMDKLIENNLKPEDITDIINTHLHPDHVANNVLFKNATKYTPSGIAFPDGKARVYLDRSKITLPGTLEMLQTPGHTLSHCSVIYKWEGKTYVICGDAFRENWFDKDKPFFAENFEQAMQSIRKIFEIADIVIPGHYKILEGKDLEDMKIKIEEKFKKWGV